jgi:hypothetical protein
MNDFDKKDENCREPISSIMISNEQPDRFQNRIDVSNGPRMFI